MDDAFKALIDEICDRISENILTNMENKSRKEKENRPSPIPEKMYEAAKVLCKEQHLFSHPTLLKRLKDGSIRGAKIGSKWFIAESELRRLQLL